MTKRPGDDLINPSNKIRKDIVSLYSQQLSDYSPEEKIFFQKFYEFYSTFWPMPNFPQRDYLESEENFRISSQSFSKDYEDWIFNNFRGLIKKDGTNYNLPYFTNISPPNYPPWRMRASFQIPLHSSFAPPSWPEGTNIIIKELFIGFGSQNSGTSWKQWLATVYSNIPALTASMNNLIQQYTTYINPIPKNQYYDNVYPVGPWGSNGSLKFSVPHEWGDRKLFLFKTKFEPDAYQYPGFPDFRGLWDGEVKYLKAFPRPDQMAYPPLKIKQTMQEYDKVDIITRQILGSRLIGEVDLINSENFKIKNVLNNAFRFIKEIRKELVQYFKENAEDVLLFYGIHPDYQTIENNFYFDLNHIIVFDLFYKYFKNTEPFTVWKSFPPIQGEPIELFNLPPSLDLINSPDLKRIFNIDLWKTETDRKEPVNRKLIATVIKNVNFWNILTQCSNSINIFSYDWTTNNNYIIGKYYRSTLTKFNEGRTFIQLPNVDAIYKSSGITVWTNLNSQLYFLKIMADQLVKQMEQKNAEDNYNYPGLIQEFYTGTHFSEFAISQFKDIIDVFPQSKRHYSDEMWKLRRSWKNDYEGIIDLDIFRSIWTEKIPIIKVPSDYDRTKHPPAEWPIEVFEDAVYDFMRRYPVMRPVREGLIEQIKQFFFNPEDAFQIGLDVQWQVYLVWVETNVETLEVHPVGEDIIDPNTKTPVLDKKGHAITNTYADIGFLKTEEKTVGFWKLIFPVVGFVLFGSSWKAIILGTISLLFKAVLEALRVIYNAIAPALPYLLGIGAVVVAGLLGYNYVRTRVEESAKNSPESRV